MIKFFTKSSTFLFLLFIQCLITTGCIEQEHVTLTLKPDGTCVCETEMTLFRKQVEQMVEWEESYRDENHEPQPNEHAGEDKPASQEAKLKKKVREMLERGQYSSNSEYGEKEFRLDEIEIKKDVIRVKLTTNYPSMKDFVMQNPLDQLGYDRIRIDEAEGGKLRLAFSNEYGETDGFKEQMDRLTGFGFKGSLKVIMPGKIVSSSLPESEGNSTRVGIDTTDRNSTKIALAAMSGKSLTVVSEKGGLKIRLPLDSEEILESEEKGRLIGRELPITEAGPGYVAEAVSVATTQVIYFPEGKKILEGQEDSFDLYEEEQKAVIRTRLYPPKGRFLLCVEKMNNIRATDDKDREVAARIDDNASEAGSSYYFDIPEDKGRADFYIDLELPRSDADSIEKVTGQAVIVTCGKWKEYHVNKIQADRKKTHDLSPLAPGATMIIEEIKQESPNYGKIELQLKGPEEVRYLDFKVETLGKKNLSTDLDDAVVENDNQTVRNVTISFSDYDQQPAVKDVLSLTVRLPDEVKRESVQFRLEAVDLH